MDYLDLILRVDTGDKNSLMVRLVDSPAGQAEAPFLLPAIEEEVKRAATGFERLVDDEEPYRDVHQRTAGGEECQRTIGDQLFKALFPEPIRDLYYQSLGLLGPRPDLGLRIKLQMGLGDPRLIAAHDLPWECLHRAKDGTFLGRERRTSIARYLDLPLPGGRPSLSGPLRVLVVAAQPSGLSLLPHLERERQALLDLGRGQNDMEMVPLATPTLRALRDALLADDFHVIHFLGHGKFEAATGEGQLFLEDETGGPAPVKGPVLADLFRGVLSLRLVVLNACQTARFSAPGPFGGVATALLRAGLPAVVAMQFPISDRAASAFGMAFYHRLALGDPIDAAVAEGRLAIRGDLPDSAEWATPALFLRAPDGRLFEPRRHTRKPQKPVRKQAPKPILKRARKPWAVVAVLATLCLATALFLFQDKVRRPSSEGSIMRLPVDEALRAGIPPREPRAETGCAPIPEEYRDKAYGQVLYVLDNRCERTLSLDEQAFMVGLAAGLASRCDLPADITSRLAIEKFLSLSRFVVATNQTAGLPPALANRRVGQDAVREGTLTARAMKCDDAQARQLARGIVGYLDRTGSREGHPSTWVNGCMKFFLGKYTEAQCRCAADAGRAAIPEFQQKAFSPNDFLELRKANVVLGWWWLQFQCRIIF